MCSLLISGFGALYDPFAPVTGDPWVSRAGDLGGPTTGQVGGWTGELKKKAFLPQPFFL